MSEPEPSPKNAVKLPDPFLDAWVKRTRKRFSGSGSVAQVAWIFSQESSETPEVWQRRLRSIFAGRQAPTLEVMVRLDQLSAGNSDSPENPQHQGELF